ncbi:hypothetical protein HJG60_007901 [Phyllostomus discolor]|uniref:Uncharacterized protein n=1 Tax=Phyllostomus discolor TaxID=89673 RepID=A0A834EVA9_9CHIR|nr:hypothetical protein HJG60_007901 [Phyllostomus discolor]
MLVVTPLDSLVLGGLSSDATSQPTRLKSPSVASPLILPVLHIPPFISITSNCQICGGFLFLNLLIFGRKARSGLWPPTRDTGRWAFCSPHFLRLTTGQGVRFGLFPVTEGIWLVSFPPLTNMLKFSGSLQLI